MGISFIITLVIIGIAGLKFLRNIFSRKKPYPKKIPEIQQLAEKMGIELSDEPFWEIDNEKTTAMSRGDSKKDKRIIFGKHYLESLTDEEKKFVAGHEFTHLYGHQFVYFLITGIPIFILAYIIPYSLEVPFNIITLGFFGAVIGWMCFSNRSFETIADVNGATFVGIESAINALKKGYPDTTKKFYLHPSTKSRTKNLQNYYNNK